MNSFVRKTAFKLLAIAGRNDRGKIVFYHDIHRACPVTNMSTSWDLFQQHVSKAKELGFSFVNAVPRERKTIQVCLDDGFSGVWDVRERLVALGVLPTVYIAVDLIGKPGYLSHGQILDLQALGFDFECHTWTHRGLTEIDEKDLAHEIVDAKMWLQDFLQKEVRQLCFPKGLFSRKIYDRALLGGYTELISSIPGSVDQGVLPNVVPRNLVQFYSVSEYACVLNGALSSMRNRYVRMHVSGGL